MTPFIKGLAIGSIGFIAMTALVYLIYRLSNILYISNAYVNGDIARKYDIERLKSAIEVLQSDVKAISKKTNK
jgi:hypothetical protein